MRKAIIGLMWLLLAVALSGCTHLSYDPATRRISYWQCLQNKTVSVETADGSRVTYSSDNTPIIVLSDTAKMAGKVMAR